MCHLVDVLSARFVPQVWRTELIKLPLTRAGLDPIGFKQRHLRNLPASEGSGPFSIYIERIHNPK